MHPSKFQITRQTLAEMAAIASKSPLDTSKLTHTEVQQVLTISSLAALLATYQIDLEVELAIKEIEREDTTPAEED